MSESAAALRPLGRPEIVYIYEIRESALIAPNNTSAMLEHKEKSWLTLITCEDYKEATNTYSSRRMVRAVLVSIIADKKPQKKISDIYRRFFSAFSHCIIVSCLNAPTHGFPSL